MLWGVILGDFLHNVRSALDHLVWQLVLLSEQQAPGVQHQFPIALSERAYLASRGMRERMLAGVADEHRAVIDQVQPFRLGDEAKTHSLAYLSRLSNTDKHRILPIAMFRTHEPKPDDFLLLDGAENCEIEVEVPDGPLTESTVLATLRIKGAESVSAVIEKAQIGVEFAFLDSDGYGLTANSFREVWARVGSLIFEFKSTFGATGEMTPLDWR